MNSPSRYKGQICLKSVIIKSYTFNSWSTSIGDLLQSIQYLNGLRGHYVSCDSMKSIGMTHMECILGVSTIYEKSLDSWGDLYEILATSVALLY